MTRPDHVERCATHINHELGAVIDSFQGEYRFLSNFHPARIIYGDVEYPSVENAYQAAKTLNPGPWEYLRLCTPGQAKRFGRQVELRPGWEGMKLDVMRMLVEQKFFEHLKLGDQLLATGDAVLIEGNNWNDTYWGVCRGQGANHLGRILMDVRDMLRSSLA